ncbi:hypothetical protein BBO_05596 [Beauveria brongniartii RCEF 3172]|uniref:Uncharacterized protein n=1 Tax=Beauveria brongniartii RCEF 3172 TaxID=1081107 RepID=A0A167CUY1_9HYPO|nr:hypothetical protein BBO_05596 [Beauveria brongniartii RCEF 3172]
MSFALFRQILPLIITLGVVGGIGFVLYHVYLSVTKMGETASQKMGKKNVVLTKDGMRVGVKNVRNERYVDKTQSYVVKAWNLGQAQEYAALTLPWLLFLLFFLALPLQQLAILITSDRH